MRPLYLFICFIGLTDIATKPVGSSSAEQDAIMRRQMGQFRPVIREMRLE